MEAKLTCVHASLCASIEALLPPRPWEHIYLHGSWDRSIWWASGGSCGEKFELFPLWVREGCPMAAVHCGVNVQSGSKAVGKLAEYPVETEREEAYKPPMERNPTFIGIVFSTACHGSCRVVLRNLSFASTEA